MLQERQLELKIQYDCLSGLEGLTLSSELVDELGLPVEHDVLLVFNSFFLSEHGTVRFATS